MTNEVVEKFYCDASLKSGKMFKHKTKMEKKKSGPIQQSFTRLHNVGSKKVFHQDLCKTLIEVNIPLKILQRTNFGNFHRNVAARKSPMSLYFTKEERTSSI